MKNKKLKTLKDLRTIIFSENRIVPKRIEELLEGGHSVRIVLEEELRQEAIKHIKFQDRPIPENLKIMPEKITIETKKISEICNKYLIEWIKNFFNINEKEIEVIKW